MKMVKTLKDSTSLGRNRQAVACILWAGILTTLFFDTSSNDPFNAPKSWVLSVAGFWLFGWIVFNIRNYARIETTRWAIVLAVTYLLSMSFAFLATDNTYIGFFGEYQRKTGYLSYFSLIVIFLAASFLITIDNVKLFENAVLAVGFITASYGFLQHFNHDFVKWNNPFNPVITTLGNPDFAAAVMAIFAVISFGIAIRPDIKKWLRLLAGFNVALLFLVINFSQVRQGVFAAVIGIVVVLIVWLNQRNKILAYGLSGFSIICGGFGIAGMLNKGPLTSYIYKASVTYRGDYWRAGWRMFVHHPWFGVGLDRYGSYFRQYRDATQSLRRGPDLIANAAHNVPLQLASTGGIFVLLSFLTLTIFIGYRGISALRNTQGTQQLLVAAIFGAWVAYEAQSFVSIDNLAIAIWGYILGGAIVGISFIRPQTSKSGNPSSSVQPMVSIILALIPVTISALFLQSESAMLKVSKVTVPHLQQVQWSSYETFASKPLTFKVVEPNFEGTIASDFAQLGDYSRAESTLIKIIKNDPRNFASKEILSEVYEVQKNWKDAIEVRKTMLKLDPYNQILLLKLGHDYKLSGDTEAARGVIGLIDAFAPNSIEAKQAHTDFGK
jgi:O-antigen ligase